MKHFYHLLIFVGCCLLANRLDAQQTQRFTQYQFTGLAFNPAFAGSDQYFNAFGIHRTQWTGITDAPRTYQLGIHAPSKSQKMGFGGTLFTDIAGPTKRFGLQGDYAYHLRLTESTKLSMGLAFGLTQFSIDGSQINLREEGDQALNNSMQSEMKPDASFGVLYYSDRYYAGASATQILNNKLDLFPGDGDGSMAVHYYFTGAYRFSAFENVDIEPSVLIKYVDPTPAQIDLSARISYKRNLWLGGTYRTNDAAAIFAGYRLMDYMALGYSYDFTTSDLKNYSGGTHEIMIQLRFVKKTVQKDIGTEN